MRLDSDLFVSVRAKEQEDQYKTETPAAKTEEKG